MLGLDAVGDFGSARSHGMDPSVLAVGADRDRDAEMHVVAPSGRPTPAALTVLVGPLRLDDREGRLS